MKENIRSSLILDKLVFDKIEFNRLDFSSESDFNFEIQSKFAKSKNEVYRVTLLFKGEKPKEYNLEISLTGFFTFNEDHDLSEELKEVLITKNAVAMIMPYLRSEVSLLTAQPGVECVVLPAFNINNMFEKDEK